MTEQKQRDKFEITEEWQRCKLVFDYDPKHEKSHGKNKYGEWSLRIVECEGEEFALFASGRLVQLLDYLEINKRDNAFQIREQAAINPDGKPYKFFEIKTANGLFDTKTGAPPKEETKPITEKKPSEEQPPQPTAVDDAISLVGEVMDKYIKELKKVAKAHELADTAWEKLYSATHISTILIQLGKK